LLSDQCCIEGETKADEWSSGGGRGGGGWPYEKKEGGKREGEVSDARPRPRIFCPTIDRTMQSKRRMRLSTPYERERRGGGDERRIKNRRREGGNKEKEEEEVE